MPLVPVQPKRSPYDVVARELGELLQRHGYVTRLGKPLDVIQLKGTWIIGDGYGDPEHVLRDLEVELPGLPHSLARMVK